ncbi:MAG: DUF3592 domain-containing protein [Armatimonadetes bacterium]|nr:DUF3592 domain-containing protein [Armatimonadota bacterium]
MESYPVSSGRTYVRYSPTDTATLTSAALVLLCVAALLVGIWQLWSQDDFLKHSLPVTATVTAVDVRTDWSRKRTRKMYSPTFTFTPTGANAPVTLRSRMATGNRVDVGDSVPVLYREGNPTDADLESNMKSSVVGWAFVLFGSMGVFATGFHVCRMLVGYETNTPPD